MSAPREFTAGFMAAGIGVGALGFMEALGRLGDDTGRFRALGGIDNDAGACADFEYLTGAPALCADLHTLTPAELRAAWGDRRPDCIFSSPPCKGFSGLLSKARSEETKYQVLNELVLKCMFLACETWDAPPPLLVIENVPRIATRGAELLSKVRQLLRQYGYAFHEGTHDCGEVGGLAQHRRRYLLVARHEKSCTAYVYQPPKLRVRGCGEVLGELPLPTDPDAGRLHQLPKISWLNWVRLALIPAGGDWRDLPRAIEPQPNNPGKYTNKLKMIGWEQPSPSVIGGSDLLDGNPSVADPRIAMPPETFRNVLGINSWNEPTGVVAGASRPSNGRFSVADPRVLEVLALGKSGKHSDSFKGRPGLFGVADWADPSGAVTGRATVSGGTMVAAVADPRLTSPVPAGAQKRSVHARYDVRSWQQPARVVAGPGVNGGYGVADPRVAAHVQLGCEPRAGTYGVVGWEQAAATVTGSVQIDNGAASVADPREPPEQLVVIVAADGTWHRPITTLEFASLQGIPTTVKGQPLQLSGKSSSAWRERIGNAVPRQAARAIADSLLRALVATAVGGWCLGGTGIWVRKRDGWAAPAPSMEAA